MTRSGRAAVIFTDMDMAERGPSAEWPARRLLFNIGVERIVHRPEIRMIDGFDQCGGIDRCGQEIAFEPVQILDRQGDMLLGGVIGSLAKHVGGMAFFIGRGPGAVKTASGE